MELTERTNEAPNGRHAAELELARRALAGDPAALDEVVQLLACVPGFMRSRHRRMGHPLGEDDLEDAIQNALLALWRKLDSYNGRVPLQGWACGFGMIEIVKTVERRGRRRRALPLDAEACVAPSNDEVAERSSCASIALAVEHLGEPGAGIVRLKHFEMLTFREIAERLDAPVNTVKTRYYRALDQLRQSIGAPSGGA